MYKLATSGFRNHRGRVEFIKNSIFEKSRVQSTLQSATWFSDTDGTNYVQHVILGSNFWTPINWSEWETTLTANATILELNRLWGPHYATTGGDESEPVGINYDLMPVGIENLAANHLFMRVKNMTIEMDFHVDQGGVEARIARPMEFMAIIYREDEGFPAFVAGSTTVAATLKNQVPHVETWRWFPGKQYGDEGQAVVKKKIYIDVKKFYNDIDWYNDSPATSGNFWVPRGANNTFAAKPALSINMKIFARVLNPDNSKLMIVHPAYKCTWGVEFDRSDNIVTTPTEE